MKQKEWLHNVGEKKMKKNLLIDETNIKGLYVLTPALYRRDDDLIVEAYNEELLRYHGLSMKFVQENQSVSTKGVLRGLHVQKKYPQGKLVRVVEGAIYDVAVDTRLTSSTYGHWFGIELTSNNMKQLYIPEGFAHGFFVLSDIAKVCFKVSDYWHPNDEIGIPWNDSMLNIDWPVNMVKNLIIAEKDMYYEPFVFLREKLAKRGEL